MSQITPINNHQNRVRLSEAVPLAAPFSAFVFPTTYCNFHCVYCAHSMGAAAMREKYGLEECHMDMDTFGRVAEQLREFSNRLKLLSLTGQGEPMLNKNLPEMVRLAKEAGIADRIEIISNGSLLTPALSDALLDAGLDALRISLQGLNAEKYKEVCGVKLDFERFLDNLRYFYGRRGSCELLVKVMDVALADGEEERFYQLFDNLSDRMFVEHCRPVYDGVDFTESLKNETADRYGNAHAHRKVCPLCFFQLAVFPNGDVAPCDAIYMPVRLGNVHTETLREMFTGELLRSFQRRQLRGERERMDKCSVCCAPDDVANPMDELDGAAARLLARLEEWQTV